MLGKEFVDGHHYLLEHLLRRDRERRLILRREQDLHRAAALDEEAPPSSQTRFRARVQLDLEICLHDRRRGGRHGLDEEPAQRALESQRIGLVRLLDS